MILERIKCFFRKIIKKNNIDYSNNYKKYSYSQSGEDIIIKFFFDVIKIKYPTYLDLGAHHPYNLSNTALFYDQGCRGVNVEADPDLFERFSSIRKEDINLNNLVSKTAKKSKFYIMSSPTLNTMSYDVAKEIEDTTEFRIKRILEIDSISINDIFQKYFSGKDIDFLNIDLEGIELEILKGFNLAEFRPKLICIETLNFSNTSFGTKTKDCVEFLLKNNYKIYADTYLNTILVDEKFLPE